jgi:hypothetical protein
VIGFRSATNEGPATDIIVDAFSRAQAGEVSITGSLYCDVAVRWPQLFSYSFAKHFYRLKAALRGPSAWRLPHVNKTYLRGDFASRASQELLGGLILDSLRRIFEIKQR